MSFLGNTIFAFTAGIVAFLSPCSFPLLPAYISHYLGLKENPTEKQVSQVLKKGVFGGLACSTGAVSTLVLIGLGVSIFGGLVSSYVSSLELIAGVLLVVLGGLMFSEKSINFQFSAKPRFENSYLSLFSFGIIYALATAGCVAPLFIGVVTLAISSGFPGGLLIFLSYSLGLATLLVVVTVLVSSAKEMVIDKLLGSMKYVKRVSGVVLLVVGIYLIIRFVSLF